MSSTQMRMSLQQLLIAVAAIAVLIVMAAGFTKLGSRFSEQQAQLSDLRAAQAQQLSELDALRSAVLQVPPGSRRSPGRKAAQVDRDGWPARSITLHRDKFGARWPFKADTVKVTGTLFGLCLAEVDGQIWGLNGLAAQSGYPLADVLILKYNPGPPEGDFMDVGPVRDVALRLCQQLREEHLQQPYQLP